MRQEVIERVVTAWTQGGPLPREPMTDAEYRYADGIVRDDARERAGEQRPRVLERFYDWGHKDQRDPIYRRAYGPAPLRWKKLDQPRLPCRDKAMRQELIERAVEALIADTYRHSGNTDAECFDAVMLEMTEQEAAYAVGVLTDGMDERRAVSDVP